MSDPKDAQPSNSLEAENKTSDASQQPTAGGTTSPVPRTGFQTHELVGDRFRIQRYLARGGMGEVYEAEDLELKEHVALKTIRPEMSANARTMERFRREIQLARKVTHPNVCRIFDVFHHRTSGTAVTFLSMELLQGETLSEHLRRTGRMKTEDALPIVQQMADALTAAHQAGVVHRDFKSSNVVLQGL